MGIEISDKTKSAFKDFQKQNTQLPLTRWTAPENLHLTAYFFGNTRIEMLGNLISLIHLGLKSTKPFELKFDKYGFGPNPQNPRMIWARYERLPAFQQLVEEMTRLYLPINPQHQNWKKPRPHITLARFKEGAAVEHIEWKALPPPSLKVEELVLWKSIMLADGPKYFEVERWVLGR